MSAAPASGAVPTSKAVVTDKTADSTKDTKPAAALEEDDEFEDFPAEDWADGDTVEGKMGQETLWVEK